MGKLGTVTYFRDMPGRLWYSAAMPRIARIIVPGAPHHITQRGNNRQDVFFVDDDRRVCLALLKERWASHG